MGNSTVTLQDVFDEASAQAELAPVLVSSTGGYADLTVFAICNDVMSAFCAGGPDGQPFPWKWNRLQASFYTNTYQQDYATTNHNIAWIQSAHAIDMNTVTTPKRPWRMEAKRDLEVSWRTSGVPCKVCWLPNDQLIYGTWGLSSALDTHGLNNPGANVVYTNPIGASITPVNGVMQIKDANGNLWVLTTYGTCGSSIPTFPSNPTYATLANPTATATTVTDGTVVWTAVDPKGQGFRLDPVPSSASLPYLINILAQQKPMKFTAMSQTLDPLPDEYVANFRNGFIAQVYRRHPDGKVRAKFVQEWPLWLKSLDNAVKEGSSEMDDNYFYTENSVMDNGYYDGTYGANYPWPR